MTPADEAFRRIRRAVTRRGFFRRTALGAGTAVAGWLNVPAPAPAGPAASGLPASSWWPEWRHDGHRSGHTDLRGAITRPAEHWRYFLGCPLADTVADETAARPPDAHDLDGTGGAYRVAVADNTLTVVDAKTGGRVGRHPLPPRKDGYYPPVVANFDPDRPGLEVVVWPVEGNYFGDFKDRAFCFSFAGGVKSGRVLWTAVPPTGLIHTPSLMVADVKRPGRPALVVMAWAGVTVWDGATGRLDYDVRWPAVRPYGYGACVHAPPDPHPYFVNVADYVPHVTVAKVTDAAGGARLLWQRHYQQTNQLATVMLRLRPHAVADLDGDGVPEIFFNLYNHAGDQKWHLLVLDLRTGETRLDTPDRFVWGVEDLDGDGKPELLCAHTTRADPRALGEVAAYRCTGSGLSRLWAVGDARFLLTSRDRLPANEFNGGTAWSWTAFTADVDQDGVREFLIERDTDGDRQPDCFEAYALDRAGRAARKWHYQAAPGQAVNARTYGVPPGGRAPALQLCEPGSGRLVSVDARGRATPLAARAPGGFATVPVAADVDGDGRCEVAVVNSRHEIELLAAPRAGRDEPVERRWKKHGFGMPWLQGYTAPDFLLALADVDGDGRVEVLFGGETRDGTATLAAARPDGSLLWEHPFPGTGTDGIYGGVTRWFTGHFQGGRHRDVGVVFHQVGLGSNQLALLDGRTGKLVWGPIATVPLPGGGGPAYVGNRPVQAVHDFDGDGADDIAYNDVYYNVILSGPTGKVLYGKSVVDVYGRTLNYAYLMLADVDDDGVLDVVLHGPTMHTMAQTFDMKKKWFVDFQGQANHFPPAFAVVDGRTVLGMPGEDGVFRCLRGADGTVLWQEHIGHPGASSVGSADVDGDGRPEFFYLDKAGELVVVRAQAAAGQGRLLWTFPVGPGLHPIFADVDGDGKGEFLLVTQDGYLRCVGPAKPGGNP